MSTSTSRLISTTNLIGRIVERREVYEGGKHHMLFKTDVERGLWDWKMIKVLFGLLVCPVMLYGCELRVSSTPISKWKQIEKIQKCFIMSKFKIKSSVPYEIMLSETGTTPIEAIALVRLMRYLKRIEKMRIGRWPNVIFNEGMSERKHG